MRRSVLPFLGSAAAHAAVLALAASFLPGDPRTVEPVIAVEYVAVAAPAVQPPAPPAAPPAPVAPQPAAEPVPAPPVAIPPPRPARVAAVRPRPAPAVAPRGAVPPAADQGSEAAAVAAAPPADIAPSAIAPSAAPPEAASTDRPTAPAPAPAAPAGAPPGTGPARAVALAGVARSPVAYATNPKPAYPTLARTRGLEGRVVLRVSVGEAGAPGDIDVVQSSGYAVLDRAARDGVARWRFQAAMVDGRTVPGTIDVPVVFRLND